MPDQDRVRQAKELNKKILMSKPNVVGVGVGEKVSAGGKTGENCVVVLVREKVPLASLTAGEIVPKDVNGVKTDVIQVGELRALQTRTERWRPAPGGVSLGHYQITAGTLGVVVQDRISASRLILSNNHVLANCNAGSPGDPILQPGAADGGLVEQDQIARLERFSPIQFGVQPPDCNIAKGIAGIGNVLAGLVGSKHRLNAIQVNSQAVNRVDAALARPDNTSQVLDNILEIGTVSGTTTANLGMAVRKSGRTTALTTGTILVIDATLSVSYGSGRIAIFEGQLVAGPMSQGGDSGSLVVAADSRQAVGLLFAGSEQITIFNPIQAVLDALQVDL